ncbi:MAG: GumC family protein [Candidatus Binataceae bacterium]
MEPSRYFIRRNVFPQPAVEAEAFPSYPDENEPLIDLRAYWRVIRKHLRFVIGFFAAVVMLTALHVGTEAPTYTAETTIQIEPNAQQGADSLENLIELEAAADNSEEYYATQCQILQSRNLAAQVIRTLGLTHNPAFAGRNTSPSLLTQFGHGISIRLADWLGSAPTEPSVKSDRDPGQLFTADLNGDNAAVPIGLVHLYLQDLKVAPVKNTSLIKISFNTPDAELSARLANAHVQAYVRQQIEMHSQSSQSAQRFLQDKLVEIKEQLQQSEAALNDYRREKGIIPGLTSLDGKDEVVLDRLADLSKSLTEAQVAKIGLEAQTELINKHQYSSLPAVLSDTLVTSLDKQLNGLYADQAAMSNQFTPDYPPLARLQARIHEVQGELSTEINRVVTGIRTAYSEASEKENELQQEMDRQRKLTLKLNDSAAQYAILRRDVDTNRSLYNSILTKLKDVTLAGDMQSTNVAVISSAEVPSAPSSPNKPRAMMFAIVFGMAGSVGLAFALEFLDNTLKNPEDAENYLHLPNLGVVPEFKSMNGKSPYGPRELPQETTSSVLPPGRELVTSHGSYSTLGEAYRNLRTALLLSRAGAPPKVTLITSAMSGEGKTVTSVNTAIMLAQMGGRTLLIDADLRRARCHRVLAVDNHLGLTEVLTGSRTFEEMVRTTEIENLSFLSSGSVPPNPTELLGSAKMVETMAQLRETYEYVVIDSSPVLPVSDSLLLSKLVDGVMIVANGSGTPRQHVKAACARLEYARAKILGVVLNKIKVHSAGYHYYYHQDYYAYENDLTRDDDDPV